MKKILFTLLILALGAYAKMFTQDATPKIADSSITIIDIRTAPEWKETGIVKNSIPITFFDEQGNYDIDSFLKQISPYVSKDKKFALICRTGHRTGLVADFLGNRLGYDVVSLNGGVMKLVSEGYKLTPYNP